MLIQPAGSIPSIPALDDPIAERRRTANGHADIPLAHSPGTRSEARRALPSARKLNSSGDLPRLGAASIVRARKVLPPASGNAADATGVASNPSSRTKRGGVLGKCPGDSPFRECRGGEALELSALSYDPFDQANYASTSNAGGRPLCEGWVREALRRLDRNDGGAVNLPAAVRQMRTDANTRLGNVASDMFSRVGRFQDQGATLAFHRYTVASTAHFNGRASRRGNMRDMFQSLQERLGVNDIAYIRLGAVSPGAADEGYGHAVIAQRLSPGQYAIFDPNNGAFLYSSRRGMAAGLRRYMDAAFEGTGLQLRPDSIQYYTIPTPGRYRRGWSADHAAVPAVARATDFDGPPGANRRRMTPIWGVPIRLTVCPAKFFPRLQDSGM